jgi:ATPase subunit of ABC transporter with duplicated ATPase domains
MVLAKTQIRSRLEAENAQREKKIAQLNEFIARFSAGTRSSQVTSRKKEVERLATSDLARSNIARPFIRFDMKRPSGRHALEIKGLTKSYDGAAPVISNFHGQHFARREDWHYRPERRGKDDDSAFADRVGAGNVDEISDRQRRRSNGVTRFRWAISRRIIARPSSRD